MSHSDVTDATFLQRYRTVQRLSYDCAESVAATLDEGVTEREVAARLHEWLTDRGVREWFHTPFAWFGDRTAFRGFATPVHFFPTRRRLGEGMPYILDVAPVLDRAVGDIGYARVLGENAIHDELMTDLAAHRDLIPRLITEGATLREVYLEVDELIRRQGYDNRHRVYPGRVIAHQVGDIESRIPRFIAFGFGSRAVRTLVGDLMVERAHNRSPLWASGKISDHRPEPGLWAVEPHIGFRDVGVKFEEALLVRPDGSAVWLDDETPHVRRWRRQGLACGSGEAPGTPETTTTSEAAA
ncbi:MULTISPECIES: M24 family metallopeptidase [unclassified Dietzia]|uniref:M24 family metallopeptidase n=1 Tax=unclassified Dietzia TaxID=2617939 RepID=UPI000D2045AE|nr:MULTISPECIES: M24 family metallopeptidase [unclassified Dietzia]AVZ41303.1 Xaa-Pro aminopeptidase [Dietzia sp. JS16-p6b]